MRLSEVGAQSQGFDETRRGLIQSAGLGECLSESKMHQGILRRGGSHSFIEVDGFRELPLRFEAMGKLQRRLCLGRRKCQGLAIRRDRLDQAALLSEDVAQVGMTGGKVGPLLHRAAKALGSVVRHSQIGEFDAEFILQLGVVP